MGIEGVEDHPIPLCCANRALKTHISLDELVGIGVTHHKAVGRQQNC